MAPVSLVTLIWKPEGWISQILEKETLEPYQSPLLPGRRLVCQINNKYHCWAPDSNSRFSATQRNVPFLLPSMSCPKDLLYYLLDIGMGIGRRWRISKRNGKVIRSDEQSICSPNGSSHRVSRKKLYISLTDAFDTGNLVDVLNRFFVLNLDHH